jgi:hypothetical protein
MGAANKAGYEEKVECENCDLESLGLSLENYLVSPNNNAPRKEAKGHLGLICRSL